MLILKIILVMLLIIVLLLVASYILYVLWRKSRYNKVISKKLSPTALFHETVCSEYFRNNVFTGFFFPSAKDKNGIIRKYSKIDSVILTRGGIAVVSLCDRSGRIDNTKQAVWVQCIDNRVLEFENPEIRNENNKRIIASILRENNIKNIPLYSVVVFTDKQTELLSDRNNVFVLNEFTQMIKQMNHENALTIMEMFTVQKIIDTYKRRSSEVKEHMERLKEMQVNSLHQ